MRRRRPGIVLPIVLLVLLVVELLAAGALALACLQHSLARERVGSLRAQLAARSGTADLIAHWDAGQYQTFAPGARSAGLARALDSQSRYSTTLERLSASLFLTQADGAAGPPAAGAARARAGRLVAVLDIARMAAQFGAAFSAPGGVQLTGLATIDADHAVLPPSGWSATECSTWLPLPVALPALIVADATTVGIGPSAIVTGSPPILEQPGSAALPVDVLGELDFAGLRAAADRIEAGTIALAAIAAAGACTTGAPGNWGAPLNQAHPCAGYFPLIFAPGDLAITSGAGQGVLIVDGDLSLAAGVQFYGIVLVRGRIQAGLNAEIVGAAQAGSLTPSLLAGASIVRSNCALSRALSRGPALNRAQPRTPRSWIPLY
jgi:hypothetical protein